MRDMNNKRDVLILNMREVLSKTYREIGEELGITQTRVNQIYNRAVLRRKYWEMDNPRGEDFDTEALRKLVAAAKTVPGGHERDPGHYARKALRLLAKNGLTLEDTRRMTDEELLKIEMFGAFTLVLVRLATGLPHPFKQLVLICPHCGGKVASP